MNLCVYAPQTKGGTSEVGFLQSDAPEKEFGNIESHVRGFVLILQKVRIMVSFWVVVNF